VKAAITIPALLPGGTGPSGAASATAGSAPPASMIVALLLEGASLECGVGDAAAAGASFVEVAPLVGSGVMLVVAPLFVLGAPVVVAALLVVVGSMVVVVSGVFVVVVVVGGV
jgi:hypothetical protein